MRGPDKETNENENLLFQGYGHFLMAYTSALAQAETGARIKVRFREGAAPKGIMRITAASGKIVEVARGRFSARAVVLA